jgi:CRISPR-associated endonuclease Csn1
MVLPTGEPKPYKGYKGDSNYCIEIVRNEKGKWEGEVVSTFEAYQIARQHGASRLRHPLLSISNKPLVMRLLKNDCLQLTTNDATLIYRVCWVRSDTRMAFAELHEANVDSRDRDKDSKFGYLVKSASTLQGLLAKSAMISPDGNLKLRS